MTEIYLVRHRHDHQLWWSNEGGWASLDQAIVYAPEERAELKPPSGGVWVKFAETQEES